MSGGVRCDGSAPGFKAQDQGRYLLLEIGKECLTAVSIRGCGGAVVSIALAVTRPSLEPLQRIIDIWAPPRRRGCWRNPWPLTGRVEPP